jgi:hypothetical protein
MTSVFYSVFKASGSPIVVIIIIINIIIIQDFSVSVIPEGKKLRQKDYEFEANLGYIVTYCPQKTK